MVVIDSHVHLCDVKDIERMLNAASEMDVLFVSCGYDSASNRRTLEIAGSSPRVFPCVGLAPQRVIELSEGELDAEVEDIKELAKRRVYGIGEVGLDYHWAKDEEERERQRAVFSELIDLSVSSNLPLVVHSRDAEEEVIRTLIERGVRRAMLHCFSGGESIAMTAAQRGFYISIPPMKSKERKKVARSVPMEHLLIETDIPYLAKDVSGILGSAEIVAKAKGISIDEVLKKTSENAKKLFAIEWSDEGR